MTGGLVAVGVPARDEGDRVTACLESLVAQGPQVRVLLSDNASQDATPEIARSFEARLALQVRTIGPMGASEHFVSVGRWLLETQPDADAFALLAGDDEWGPEFVSQAHDALCARPDVAAVFPTFVWTGGDESDRTLAPTSFLRGGCRMRRLKALALADRRELANLVYGVYRRDAFADLMDAWERGGDRFAADYAAACWVVGRHRVAAIPRAVGRRHVRTGVDLIERVGASRPAGGPLAMVVAFVRLNLRINSLIAAALVSAGVTSGGTSPWAVQLIRAPQWLGGSVRQVVRVLRARPSA